jgi:uncharacterized membrane protein YebE (DUF533 family)
MDTRVILEQLLQAGQNLAKQGQGVAEKKLSIPEAGPERDAMLSGLGKGAAAASALALLLGTGAGRRVTGTALKLGSLAAIGTAGYQAYKNWQTSQAGTASPGKSIHELSDADAERRSLTLVKAMIAAAKADGHIDNQEKQTIQAQIQQLGLDPDAANLMQAEIEKPLDPDSIAQGADSPEAAVEIYLTSLLVIDSANAQEQAYLDNLATSLNLTPELVSQLKAQVKD